MGQTPDLKLYVNECAIKITDRVARVFKPDSDYFAEVAETIEVLDVSNHQN